MMVKRRSLLCAIGAGGALAMGAPWVMANSKDSGAPRRLIVVFLRGAADGLNIVVPYTESEYYRQRPKIAIARPGDSMGALDLDGHFGLHPSLLPLMGFWQQGQLAFVQASGSPDPSRSHFDAQDNMETGTPGLHGTPTGWINRLGTALPAPHGSLGSSLGIVSIGATVPRIVSGPNPVTTVAQGNAAARAGVLDQTSIGDMFALAYANDPRMAAAFKDYMQTRPAVRASLAAAEQGARAANMGVPADYTFGADAVRLGAMMRRDPKVQLGFLSVSGWDTHSSQNGQLAAGLARLGSGLTALVAELGDVYRDTVIVVMSEFGRSVSENGSLGTDHGHGNVMWLLGAQVAGGKVYGDWPGLAQEELFERRDLAVTTDFRIVLSQVCLEHLRVRETALTDVFPQAPIARTRMNLFRG